MLSTKISGLAVDTEYTFHLVLRTSAGTYSSEKLRINTQKMTDLTGITITPGPMPPPLLESLKTAIERIGMKFAETVRIDTTHFVCTEGRGPEWEKAKELNVPVVRPEWVEGCEREGRIVGVRGYYLGADPKTRQVGPSVMQQSPQLQQGSSQGGGQQDLQRRETEALAMRQRERMERGGAGGGGGEGAGEAGGAASQDSPLPPPTPAKDEYLPAGTNAAGVPSSADDESEDDHDAEEQRRRLEKTPQPRADDESESGDHVEEDDELKKEKAAMGGLKLDPPAGREEAKDDDEEEDEEEEGGKTPGGGVGEGFSEVAL